MLRSEIIIAVIGAFVSSFGLWFFSRKKHRLENIDMAIGTWQKIVDNLETRIDRLLKDSESLREENNKLRQEVSRLGLEIEKFKLENKRKEDYVMQIAELEKRNRYFMRILDDRGIVY